MTRNQLAVLTRISVVAALASILLLGPALPRVMAQSSSPIREPLIARFAVRTTAPTYPAQALQAHKSAIVIARASIGKDGKVTSTEILSGGQEFGKAVETAVRDWTFAFPTREGEEFTGITGVLVFRFAEAEDAKHGRLLFGSDWSPPPCSSAVGKGGVIGGVPDPDGVPGKEPGPQRVSGGVLAGRAIYVVSPSYPAMAKQAGIEGSVVVEVVLDELGMVACARSISGHPLLREAAETAAWRWTFSPTLLEGTPVRVIGTITFNFRKT
jgi:TonB family protein